MESRIIIVPAEEAHFPAAAEIAVKAWTPIRQEYKKLLGEDMYDRFFTDWQNKKKNAVVKGLSGGHGYVALVDDCVAGFISYTVNHETKLGEIMDNAVDPSYRGMGIGTMMYRYVLAEMQKEGMCHAVVTTGLDDAHAPARRSYEKAGFEKGLPYVKYYMELK